MKKRKIVPFSGIFISVMYLLIPFVSVLAKSHGFCTDNVYGCHDGLVIVECVVFDTRNEWRELLIQRWVVGLVVPSYRCVVSHGTTA